jgi:hypothetical protein
MPKNKAPATRFGRHPLASPSAARRRFRRRSVRRFFRCHRTADFEGLVEIVGEARGLISAVSEIDAILAGQAPEGDAEGAKLGGD